MAPDPDFDPFKDPDETETPAGSTPADDPWGGPIMTQQDNWVSFSFVSDSGYDKLQGTVHGDPEYVAEMFAIEDYDGKISTLMRKAVLIDKWFKGQAAKENPGKG